VQEATQWQSVVTFVETGMGVSIAPEGVRKFRWKGVVYRPLSGLETTVSICWQDTRDSAAMAAFRDLSRAEFRHRWTQMNADKQTQSIVFCWCVPLEKARFFEKYGSVLVSIRSAMPLTWVPG
jgi:hypothetical protein